jgi:hypothetical protein
MRDTRVVADIRWSDAAARFADDSPSALRELVVPDVGFAAWQRFLERILAPSWTIRYWSDGVPASLPLRIEDIFDAAARTSVALQIELDGLEVDVWFFDEHVVHCSVGASMVTSQLELDRLLSFIRVVGGTCAQPVYMTYEGREADPRRNAFLVYEPSDDRFRAAEPSPFGGGPILGEASRLLVLEEGDTLRLLLRQDAEWVDSVSQLDEIEARLQSVTTYVLSEQLDWERRHSATKQWRIEIRCLREPPPLTAETFEKARDSIRVLGGDLMIKPPEANVGLFD